MKKHTVMSENASVIYDKKRIQESLIIKNLFLLKNNDFKGVDIEEFIHSIYAQINYNLKMYGEKRVNNLPDQQLNDLYNNLEKLVDLMERAKPALRVLANNGTKEYRDKIANKSIMVSDSNNKVNEFESKLVLDFYNKAVAAKFLNVSRQTINNWVNDGKIKTTKSGSRNVITKEEMIRFYKEYILNLK